MTRTLWLIVGMVGAKETCTPWRDRAWVVGAGHKTGTVLLSAVLWLGDDVQGGPHDVG